MFGGGYYKEKIGDGEYKILEKTNVSPLPRFEEVKAMWAKLAREACGGPAYSESKVKVYTYQNSPRPYGLPGLITTKEGVARCEAEAPTPGA